MLVPNMSPLPNPNSSNMNNNLSNYSYWSSYMTASPAHPPDAGISPPMLYNLSSGVMLSDGMQSSRLSHGSGSHSAPVPHSHHFNPIAAPATCSKVPPCRRSTKNENSDDDQDGTNFQPTNNNSGGSTDMCCKTIHCQCIKVERQVEGWVPEAQQCSAGVEPEV